MLFRGWPEQAEAIEWRDVDQRPEWREAYGEQVPVLIQGEETICVLQPDLDRIAQYFGEMTNPV